MHRQPPEETNVRPSQPQLQETSYIQAGLKRFTEEELQLATNNYQSLLGFGGFGAVHKGVLQDPKGERGLIEVAVKSQKTARSRQGFLYELSILGKLRHKNVVELLGYMVDDDTMKLVYEFAPDKDLAVHLFVQPASPMSWEHRWATALGVAQGMSYCHDQCKDGQILHCDLKPQNILLNMRTEFIPLVADFGLALVMGFDINTVLSNRRGTVGHVAPEFRVGSQVPITKKVDVYSYGVILYELITGSRAEDSSREVADLKQRMDLTFMRNGNDVSRTVENVIDRRIAAYGASYNARQAECLFRIARRCTGLDPETRYTFEKIVNKLKKCASP